MENPPALAAHGEGRSPARPRGSWKSPGPPVNPNTPTSPQQTHKTIRVLPRNAPPKGFRKKDKIVLSSHDRKTRAKLLQAPCLHVAPGCYMMLLPSHRHLFQARSPRRQLPELTPNSSSKHSLTTPLALRRHPEVLLPTPNEPKMDAPDDFLISTVSCHLSHQLVPAAAAATCSGSEAKQAASRLGNFDTIYSILQI